MWILSKQMHKKCSYQHVWRTKFKQGTRELFVVCANCDHKVRLWF